MALHPQIRAVTDRIVRRSRDGRATYLERIAHEAQKGPRREGLSCGNLAHGFAASDPNDKDDLRGSRKPNLAIVTAYNDMLSAHQPLAFYPDLIKKAAREVGAVAQVAGGVPAMCDGITQGRPGMELSLFSRDVVAMATAVALSHDMFDAALYLGVCDKIVPGLVIGALSFGHLPSIFVPAGPMPSGLPNAEKNRVRQDYAAGKVGRAELLEAEAQSYHAPGTCTFYGTANSNQMLMEIMGLHLPGTAFVNPGTALRRALTMEAARQAARITSLGNAYRPIGRILDERAFVNGIVGLMATGGSTNHTMHLIAMAAAAGIALTWDDFADISAVTPLLARVYPNGSADVNDFQCAGGMGFIIAELLSAGLLHDDVETIMGQGLHPYTLEPGLNGDQLEWSSPATESRNPDIVRPAHVPFAAEGGVKLLSGNLGRAVIKISAVKQQHRRVRAPAVVFDSQDDVLAAFKAGKLTGDFVAVVRFQGPSANGMPELHKLTPTLGILQDRGQAVALITDGRMSGASGKVPAAIHVTPESALGGPLAKLRDGDMITLDAEAGILMAEVPDAEWQSRPQALFDPRTNETGMGRELFSVFRRSVSRAEDGASIFRQAV